MAPVGSKTRAWRTSVTTPSLSEVHRSLPVAEGGAYWRKLFAFAGPGYLVAVGYMDPGNWATDIAGGSAFGYKLLFVILLSNLMAILLQALTVRLGIATGRDLAQACRDHYSPPVTIALWLMCELAIVACDLAELIGTAIALNLLFGIPLVWGVCLTAGDVLMVLLLQKRGFRYLEAFVLSLLIIIAGCFAVEIAFSQPALHDIVAGLVPTSEIVRDPQMLYIAIGILGATVMPHNLYLHSAIVQTRRFEPTPTGMRQAITFATINSTIGADAGAVHQRRHPDRRCVDFPRQRPQRCRRDPGCLRPAVADAGRAAGERAVRRGPARSGQNSAVTATLAGQVVMEGFLRIRLPAWLRRLSTRLMAIIPAVAVAALYGDSGTAKLLVLSQVVLSMQLPFAVVPLIRFTSDRGEDGVVREPALAGWPGMHRRHRHHCPEPEAPLRLRLCLSPGRCATRRRDGLSTVTVSDIPWSDRTVRVR